MNYLKCACNVAGCEFEHRFSFHYYFLFAGCDNAGIVPKRQKKLSQKF